MTVTLSHFSGRISRRVLRRLGNPGTEGTFTRKRPVINAVDPERAGDRRNVVWLRTRLGAGNAVLQLVATRDLVALATPPLFLEYEEVLKRPEQQLAHGLTLAMVDEFLAELAALIEPVESHFQWRPQVRDPSDEMVFEAAINGNADALVTYNVSDFRLAGERFKIPILSPADLLKKVRR